MELITVQLNLRLKLNYHLVILIKTNTRWNVNVWLFYVEENRLGGTFWKSGVTKSYEDYSMVDISEGY